MNRVVCAPLFQFLQRPAGVFENLAVDELKMTVRAQKRDQARNAVQECLRIALAFPQCLVGDGELACLFRDPLLEFLHDTMQPCRFVNGRFSLRLHVTPPWPWRSRGRSEPGGSVLLLSSSGARLRRLSPRR